MDDLNGAQNGQEGVTPPVSPTGNDTPTNQGSGTPPSSVPFNEREDLQFVIRQVTRNIQDAIASTNRAQAQGMPNQPAAQMSSDDIETMTKELAQDFGIDEAQARKLAFKIKKANEKEINSLRGELDGVKMTMRFSGLYASHQDAGQYEAGMRRIWEGMNEIEKQFVLTSPDGPEHLYAKAKRIQDASFAPPAQRAAASSARGTSTPPSMKVNADESQLNDLVSSFSSGDRRAYEEKAKQFFGGR